MPFGPNLFCNMKVSPNASVTLIEESQGQGGSESFHSGSIHVSGLFSDWEKAEKRGQGFDDRVLPGSILLQHPPLGEVVRSSEN